MSDEDPNAAMMSMCKKFADDPAATPGEKMMASAFSAFAKKMSDDVTENKKRIGAFEASAEATAKKSDETQMSAFSAQVEEDVNGKWDGTKCITPGLAAKVGLTAVVRAGIKKALESTFAPNLKAFSSGEDRIRQYRDALAVYTRLPDDPQLLKNSIAQGQATSVKGADGKPVITPASPMYERLTRPGGVLDGFNTKATREARQRAGIVG